MCNIIKRILSVAVSAAIMVTAIPFSSYAAEAVTVDASQVYSNTSFSATELAELAKAEELGFPCEKINQPTISGAEFTELADKFVELVAPELLAEWQEMYPVLRAEDKPINRFDAIIGLFAAASSAGDEYSTVNNYHNLEAGIAPPMYKDYVTWDLFGGNDGEITYSNGKVTGPLDSVSYSFVLGRTSPYSGELLFAYDPESKSLRVQDDCTYAEALMAFVRLMCSANPDLMGYAPINQPFEEILTEELIAKSQSNPEITAEDHPDWHGFVMVWDYEGCMLNPTRIENIADWGFNSVKITIDYRNLLEEDNIANGNSAGLRFLDECIATAIERDLHVNFCIHPLPGRSSMPGEDDYNWVGEFDLFLNEEKQEQVNAIWSAIAERYKDISNYNLSYTLFFEADNKNLSTGLEFTDYTMQDVADYSAILVDVIREQSPDRILVYEISNYLFDDIGATVDPCHEVAEKKGNMIFSSAYVEVSFSYEHMNFGEGMHLDNCGHSLPAPVYPTYHYALKGYVHEDSDPITLTGVLPEGTTIDFYISESMNAEIAIYADGTMLYSEKLETEAYEVGQLLSGYINFATSSKKMSVTLPADTEEVTFKAQAGAFTWSGIDVYVPDEYAVEKWMFISPYDVYLGLEEEEGMFYKKDNRVIIYPSAMTDAFTATIKEELTFTTDQIRDKSDSESINSNCDYIYDYEPNIIIRFGGGAISGVAYPEMKKCCIDMLQAFNDRGFDWWSHDYQFLISEGFVVEQTIVEYEGYETFNLDYLQLLQSFAFDFLPTPEITTAEYNTDRSADISWNAVEGADSYRVFRADTATGDRVLIDTVTGTSCTDTGLDIGRSYYYFVKAYNSETGDLSEYSAAGEVNTESPVSDFTYTTNDDGIYITAYNGKDTEVIIPRTINGKSVVLVDNAAFKNNTTVIAVHLPDSVYGINEEAFYQCTALESIRLPDNFGFIGARAFYGCEKLRDITLPRGLYSIGTDAFTKCTSSTAFSVGGKNENFTAVDGVLFNLQQTNLICYPAGKNDESYAIPEGVEYISGTFAFNESLKKLSVPASVQEIQQFNLANCVNLSEITVDSGNQNYSSVSGMLYNKNGTALKYCPMGLSVGRLEIPSGTTNIDGGAFLENDRLETLVLSDTLEFINGSAFVGCYGLTAFEVDENNPVYSTIDGAVYNIGARVLMWYPSGARDEMFVLPEGITSVEGYAFMTPYTKKYVFYSEVTSIYDDAFYGNTDDITVYVEQGSYADEYFRNVSWQPEIVYIEKLSGIELSSTEMTLDIGESTELTVSPIPDKGLLGEISWTTSDDSVATVVDGTVTAVSAGNAVITAAADKFTAQCSVTINAPAPQITKAEVSGSNVIISWNKYEGATSYRVYRADTINGEKTLLKTVGTLKCTDTTAVAGKTYYYFVAAYNSKTGELSDYSEGVSVTLPAASIAAPTLPEKPFFCLNDIITVKWNAVESATSYRVYRATSETGTKTLLKTTGILQFTDQPKSGTYYYYIAAYNSKTGQLSDYSAPIKVSLITKPVIYTCTYENGGVYMTWNTVNTATSYRVFRTDADTGVKTQIKTVGFNHCNDTNIAAGKTYTYTVQAFNNNLKILSASATAKTITIPSGTKPVITSAEKITEGVALSWEGVKDATSYKIYRADSATGAKTLLKTTGILRYTDGTAVSGKTYYYFVVAYNSKTGVSSEYSEAKSITV